MIRKKALEYLRTEAKFPIVLKADGLALWKRCSDSAGFAEAKAGVKKEIMEEKNSAVQEICHGH